MTASASPTFNIQRFQTLRGLTLVLLGAILLATLVIIGGAVFAFVRNTERLAWQGRQSEAAQRAASEISDFIGHALSALKTAGLFEEIINDSEEIPEEAQEHLTQLLDVLLVQNPFIQELVLTDAEGQIDGTPSEKTQPDGPILADPITLTQSAWFNQARSGQTYLSELQYTYKNEPYVILAQPLADGGVGAIRLRMDVLEEVLGSIKVGETGDIYLVDSNGQMLANEDFEFVLDRVSVAGSSELISALQAPNYQWSGEFTDFIGEEEFGSSLVVPGTNWIIFVETQREEATANTSTALLLIGGFSILFWAVVMVLTNRLLNQLVFQPLAKLRFGAEEIEKGHLGYLVPITRRDEIGQVTDSFNKMTRRLADDITKREKAETERGHLLRRTEDLYRLGQKIAAAQTKEDLLDIAAQTAKAHGCLAYAFLDIELDAEDKPETLVMTARVSNHPQGLPVGTRFGVKDFPFANVWLSSPTDTLFISNVQMDERVDEATRGVFLALGYHAFVAVPLAQSHRWIGLILFIWDAQHEFQDDETTIYRALPALAAPVAENLRLFSNLEGMVIDLQLAKEAAEESSRVKSEFLSTMSHELRTPMNAIEGFSSIMLSNMGIELSPKARDMVERIRSNSKRLLQLINDILDLSRIEAGRTEIAHAPMSPAKLAGRWKDQLSVLAEQKHVAFMVDVDSRLPEVIYGDEEALTKIAINLLGNAFKFTQAGQVALSLKANGSNTWAIQVSDTGIGIPAHAQQYIFEEFRQVDGSYRRQFGGSGLGLAIVHKLTRAMGGSIALESEVGQGSTFTVTLPLHQLLETEPM